MSTPRSSAPSPDVIAAPPEPQRRRWNRVIVAVLALQVLIPLRYYLGSGGYDERFSWRMFSTLRLRSCRVQVVDYVREGGQSVPRPVNVERDVHVAWLRLLERMRGAVIEAYLERRCAEPHVERVTFECTCQSNDGQVLPPVRQSLQCSAGSRGSESP